MNVRRALASALLVALPIAAVSSHPSGANSGCCLTSALGGDPHGIGAHGDKFSMRGEPGRTYCILSAPNVSFNARFDPAVFHATWSKITVNGSFVKQAYWVLRTPQTGRLLHVTFQAGKPHIATISSEDLSLIHI